MKKSTVKGNQAVKRNMRDITDIHEAKTVIEKTRKELAEIKKSAEEFNQFTENVIDTIREPLLALDKDLRVIKASRSFYTFFKVTADETIGKLIYELGNHQWDIPKLKELLEDIIPEKNTFDDFEVEHNFSTIGKRVMLLNARQVKGAYGKEKIILLAIEDITERKGKEDALEETHRATSDSLDTLLDHMHAPMIIWDISMIIKRFNHQFELLSGYDSAEVIDKRIDILFPKEKVGATLELLKYHTDNELEVTEIDILSKDNQIKTVLWISSRILDEDGNNIIATISQDITSRKRTEDALTLLETRYRRLFESAKDGILILDADTGKIVDVNPFLIDLLGYSRNEFIEKSIWEIGPFNDIYENKEKFLELQQEEYVRYDDLPLATSDGREIHVEFVSNVYLVINKKVIQCNIRDITERKKVEELLQESEERYRSFFENTMDGILLTIPDGKIISANLAACNMFGYTENELIKLGRSGIIETSDPQLSLLLAERAAKGKARGELTFIRKDGTKFPCEISSAIFKNRDGIEHTSMIIRDISERIQIQQRIEASEKRFRAIFDQAPIAIALIDLKGHPIISNERFSAMLGYTKDELSEMKFTEFTYPEDVDKDLNQFTDLVAGRISSYNMEKRFIHKNGNLIWANLFVTTLNDSHGLIQEIIGMVEDITEQKKIQNKIKFQAELLFNVGQAVIATDLLGKVIYWNHAAEIIYGWSNAEAIGQNIMELTPAQQSNEQAIDIMKKLSAGKTWAGEFHVKRKGGSSFPAFVTDTPILDSNGDLIGIIGISSDITERKHAELELIEAKERAEESDRLKTAFLHNISHEIRTPMNAIVGFSGFLHYPDLKPEKRKYYTDIIIQSSDQLLAIIDDIIRIASIEAGQEKIQENEININLICNLINEQFAAKAHDKHIDLKLKKVLADDEAIIVTDATKLTQILSNLVGNALKFTQEGYINFGYRVKGNQLEFYVEDTGIGVALDMQDKIFNRFRQVETTDSRNFGGSGLGLSISKAYAEMLGGNMWLISELGKGSVFYFTIAYDNAKMKKMPDTPTEKLNFELDPAKTLLIAEDEDSNFMLLEEMLSNSGLNIIRAVNGLEAVELCKSNPDIDLVLMDIKMPEMDGYDATTRIKEFMPDLPIIAQTAYVTDADRMRALAYGCSDFISKPIIKKLLLSKIYEQLHK